MITEEGWKYLVSVYGFEKRYALTAKAAGMILHVKRWKSIRKWWDS